MRVFFFNDTKDAIRLMGAPPESIVDEMKLIKPLESVTVELKGPDAFVKIWPPNKYSPGNLVLITSCDIEHMQETKERLPGLLEQYVELMEVAGIEGLTVEDLRQARKEIMDQEELEKEKK